MRFRYFLPIALLCGVLAGTFHTRAQMWSPWVKGTPAAVATGFTHVRSTTGTQGPSTAVTTISVTAPAIASGNAVFGLVTWGESTALTITVSDGTNSYPVQNTVYNSGYGYGTAMFYRPNVTNAPTTFTATISDGGGTYAQIAVDEWSGLLTAPTVTGTAGSNNGNIPTTSPGSGTFATNAGDLVIGYILPLGATTVTPGAGFTAVAGSAYNHEYLISASTGTTQATATFSSSLYANVHGISITPH